MITREFSKDELDDAIDSGTMEVGSERIRWGSRVTYVFPRDGDHWMVTIEIHHDEGWQVFGPTTATKVHEVERVVKAWEPVP